MSKRCRLSSRSCARWSASGASVAAAYVHYQMLYDPTYRSFCDVSATFSCTQVYMSRFGTLRGIPVAIFGAIWFVVASAAVGRRPDGAAAGPGKRARLPVRGSTLGARGRSSILATRRSSC